MKIDCPKCGAKDIQPDTEDVGLTAKERKAFCPNCDADVSDEWDEAISDWGEEDICPFCHWNRVEIDDFGLTCCRRCFNEHPEWKRTMAQQQADFDFETGRPMSEED